MPSNDYIFITHWRVESTCEEVSRVLEDPLGLTGWWPTVYLQVVELRPPRRDGIGRRVRARTKGWLPYTLQWEFEVTESRHPYGFTIVAHGDFEGRGIWKFEQDGGFVNITYDWRLRAKKPLIRSLSFLLKPIFEWNHRWAMAQGEKGLKK